VKCLIIAAGQGSRLRQRAESKPLVPVDGVPLIQRVIRAAVAGGVSEFYVVSGYKGPRLREHLDQFADGEGVVVNHLVNRQWQQPNGVSVLQAKGHLRDPFGLILAVDKRLSNPLVDLDDVTRVFCSGDKIQDIGKGLSDFNAFDTGIFYSTPALFAALETSIENTGNASLSGGVAHLASLGKARIFDIGDRFWLDIDDSRSYVKAEVALIESTHQEGLKSATA
jgi:1L-myo-inositol 1-phosphate cytidylyltransferase